jgi:group I intron endonuclease
METSNKTNSGIYIIKNLITNFVYVGSTNNFRIRKAVHIRDLKDNKHHCIHLQNAWNKYGENNFKIELIQYIENESFLIPFEQVYLDFYKKFGIYNICLIAGRTIGRKPSSETLQKMRSRRHSEEVKNKISSSLKNRIPWNKGRGKKKADKKVFRKVLTCYDKDGNLISTYVGYKEAAKDGYDKGGIWRAIHNENYTYKGMIWKETNLTKE